MIMRLRRIARGPLSGFLRFGFDRGGNRFHLQLPAGGTERESGFDEAVRVADIEALALPGDAEQSGLGAEGVHGIGELDFAAEARGRGVEKVEDVGGKEVARGKGVRGKRDSFPAEKPGSLVTRGFFGKAVKKEGVGGDLSAPCNAIA